MGNLGKIQIVDALPTKSESIVCIAHVMEYESG